MTENYNRNIFLDNDYYRTTTTGVNHYTKNKKRSVSDLKLEYAISTLNDLMDKIENNKINKKQIATTLKNDYNYDIVKDCIDDLKDNKRGYVFDLDQLSKVAILFGFNFCISVDEDGIYYLTPSDRTEKELI